jgi:fringe protein
MSYQVSKMRLTLKRILQAFFLAVLFSFSTLAVLKTLSANNLNSSASDSVAARPLVVVEQEEPENHQWIKSLAGFWPDRSLRSVADESNTVASGSLLDDQSINDIDKELVVGTALESVTTQPTSTATAKPHTTLDDVFISVKTTKNFHASRLDVIIKTWFTLAREQVCFYFIFCSLLRTLAQLFLMIATRKNQSFSSSRPKIPLFPSSIIMSFAVVRHF